MDSIRAITTQWSLETLAKRKELYRATGGSVVYHMYYSHFGSWHLWQFRVYPTVNIDQVKNRKEQLFYI